MYCMTEFGNGTEGGRHALLEKETGRAVRDSWFQAARRGIGLVPQANREGAVVLLAQSVLHDPPASWNDFFHSELSITQLDQLTSSMEGYHKRYDVDRTSRRTPKAELNIVQRVNSYLKGEITPERMHAVWRGATQEVGRSLQGYIEKRYIPFFRGAPEPDYQMIERFFERAEYVDRAGELKQIFDVAADALTSQTGRALSATYRKEAHIPREERETLPKIRTHVIDAVHNQIPHAGNLEWLYGPNATLRY